MTYSTQPGFRPGRYRSRLKNKLHFRPSLPVALPAAAQSAGGCDQDNSRRLAERERRRRGVVGGSAAGREAGPPERGIVRVGLPALAGPGVHAGTATSVAGIAGRAARPDRRDCCLVLSRPPPPVSRAVIRPLDECVVDGGIAAVGHARRRQVPRASKGGVGGRIEATASRPRSRLRFARTIASRTARGATVSTCRGTRGRVLCVPTFNW